VRVNIDGRKLLNFSGNDYLGLANHPNVVCALKRGVDRFGVGSGSAHLIVGHSSAHHDLEDELAEFIGCQRVLLFSNGYMANIGVVSALLGKSSIVFEDRLNHASLIDGGLLSGAKFRRFPHTDLGLLEKHLQRQAEDKQKLIVTDGVFSMDGDLAPLNGLVRLKKRTGSWLMVDDAHGLGVIGQNGRGIVEQSNVDGNDIDVLVGTLGKAFGTFGAFVAGTEELVEFLIQKARTYIYTTALPPSIAEASRESLRLVQNESWRREKLLDLVSQFRTGAESMGLQLLQSPTPIQPIVIGDSQATVELSNRLTAKGIFVIPVRPPTVPKGSARLRITFSAMHESADIERLLNVLHDCL